MDSNGSGGRVTSTVAEGTTQRAAPSSSTGDVDHNGDVVGIVSSQLRALMPDESPIDLDEHSLAIAREITRARRAHFHVLVRA